MSRTFNIGIVGCGRILNAHLRGYKLLKDAGLVDLQITALCELRKEDALRFKKRGEGPPPRKPIGRSAGDPLAVPPMYVSDIHPDVEPEIYTDYEEMMKRANVDVIDITASLAAHHTVAICALKAGKHVMVEKPMALTVRMARAMVEAAEQSGALLSVAENAHYYLGSRAIRWVMDEGIIGQPQMMASISIGAGTWSPDRVVANTPWRHRKLEGGGGVSVDMGPHIFHRARNFVGEIELMSGVAPVFEPKRRLLDDDDKLVEVVNCEADDAFMALAAFENGAVGMFSFTWAAHGGNVALPGGMAIYGSKGCIREGNVFTDDGPQGPVTELFQKNAPDSLKEKHFPKGIDDAFALETYDLLHAIESGGVPEMSGVEGLKDLVASYAVVESHALGQTVKVGDVEAGKIRAYQEEIDKHYGY